MSIENEVTYRPHLGHNWDTTFYSTFYTGPQGHTLLRLSKLEFSVIASKYSICCFQSQNGLPSFKPCVIYSSMGVKVQKINEGWSNTLKYYICPYFETHTLCWLWKTLKTCGLVAQHRKHCKNLWPIRGPHVAYLWLIYSKRSLLIIVICCISKVWKRLRQLNNT